MLQEENGHSIDFVIHPWKGQAFTGPVYSKWSSLFASDIFSLREKGHKMYCFETVFTVLCGSNTANESKWRAHAVPDEI